MTSQNSKLSNNNLCGGCGFFQRVPAFLAIGFCACPNVADYNHVLHEDHFACLSYNTELQKAPFQSYVELELP